MFVIYSLFAKNKRIIFEVEVHVSATWLSTFLILNAENNDNDTTTNGHCYNKLGRKCFYLIDSIINWNCVSISWKWHEVMNTANIISLLNKKFYTLNWKLILHAPLQIWLLILFS